MFARVCGVAATMLLATFPAGAAEGVREVRPDEKSSTSAATVVDGALHLAHTAQLFPVDAKGQVVAAGEVEAQTNAVLDQLDSVLSSIRSDSSRIVKVHAYAARADVVPTIQAVLARRLAGKARPAIAYVVGALAEPEALVAMDAIAVAPRSDARGPANRQAFSAPVRRRVGAEVKILPAGARVYVSGQAEPGSNMVEATRKTLAGLGATLEHLGLTKADVVQVKSFLQPIAATDHVAGEIREFFGRGEMPALAFVEWRMSTPIEIELIARSEPKAGGEAVDYLTPPGLKPSPVFCRVVRVNRGDSIFVSGLYGPASASGGKQVETIFETLRLVLNDAGSDFRHLVKATYYVSDDEASRALNDLRPRYYDPARPPAASKATAAGVGAEGRSVTVDMIAVPTQAK